jgi:hypothetical protein
MSSLRPPAVTGSAAQARPTLLVMSGGRDAEGSSAMADRLALETEKLLEALEESVARLALAHRASITLLEDQLSDDEAFAWVQQSIEDVSATLRGLSLGRAAGGSEATDTDLRSVGSSIVNHA